MTPAAACFAARGIVPENIFAPVSAAEAGIPAIFRSI